MTAWSPLRTLVAGVALIALTNGVILLGVAYNRSGEPESELTLSERELTRPSHRLEGESSQEVLTLKWRVQRAPRGPSDAAEYTPAPPGSAAPPWLDQAKLVSLGFTAPPQEFEGHRARVARFSKTVLLVLELNGSAYRAELDRAREQVASIEASALAGPSDQAVQQRLQMARRRVAHEEKGASRLFVVDAGLEAERLRARYPDRTQYAIVGGRIEMQVYRRDGQAPVEGVVAGPLIREMDVPLAFRSAVSRMPLRHPGEEPAAGGSYAIRVAFGRRLEPWIRAVSEGRPPG